MSRAFFATWTSQTLVIFSVVLMVFTAGIVAYQQTGSLVSFSVVILCGYLPELLTIPLAGPVVDRVSRHRVLIACCLLQAGIFSVYLLMLRDGGFHGAVLYGVLCASSAVAGVHRLAYNASLALFTRNHHTYPRMNGLAQAGLAAAHILAPLFAGLMLEFAEAWLIAATAVIACVVAGLALLPVRFPELSPEERSAAGHVDMKTGLRFIGQTPGLPLFLLMHGFSNLARGASIVLFTPFILAFSSEAVLGSLRSAAGIGMAIGAALITIWGGPARQLTGVIASLGVCGVFMAIIGMTQLPVVIGLATFALFVATPVLAALAHSIWQRQVPAALQGRVFSIRDTCAGAALAAGYVVSPWIAGLVFVPLAGSAADGIGGLYQAMGLVTLLLACFALRQPAIRALER